MNDEAKDLAVSSATTLEPTSGFSGKLIGGHPFFEVNLRDLVKAELQMHPKYKAMSVEELDTAVGRNMTEFGYDQIEVPSYDSNNDVYLVIEPDQQNKGQYRAFISAFPSEEQYSRMRNSANLPYATVDEYADHVVDSFALPINTSSAPGNGKYEHRGMHVPFSKGMFSELGFQTQMSQIIDRMVTQK